MVAVQDFAVTFQDTGFALSASAAPAHIGRIDAGRLDRLQQALMSANGNGFT